MSWQNLKIAAGLTLLAWTMVQGGIAGARDADNWLDDELIVTYRSAADGVRAKAARATMGMATLHTLANGQVQVLRLPLMMDALRARERFAADPDVVAVEPNFIRRRHAILPSDPLFFQQWGLRSIGQGNFATDDPALASVPGGDISALAAWDPAADGSFARAGRGEVVVAVIDDAFDVTHPDLATNFIGGADMTRCNGADCAADVAPENAAMAHGTMVAGVLGAAGNNGIGGAGMIWRVKMLPLKVGRVRRDEVILDNGSILRAYEYALEHGAQVINASYGGPNFSQAEFDAITRLNAAGIALVTSAGNFNSNLDESVAAYPANYDIANVIAVAATNRQDNIASFSQFGPLSVDVAAPGLQMVTALPDGQYISGERCGQGGLCGANGTSFAAPLVTGLAALLREQYPAIPINELRARLIEGADRGAAGGDVGQLTQGGRINAARSLDMPPQPAVLLRAVAISDDNGRLDFGEQTTLRLSLQNFWQHAHNLRATLHAPAGVQVLTPTQTLPDLASNARATLRFDIAVDHLAKPYQDLDFWLDLRADGGYAAQRPFRQTLAPLTPGQRAQAVLSEGLHDDFHTWHFTVAEARAGQKLQICARAEQDIDLLLNRGAPAQYDIELGRTSKAQGTYFSNADWRATGDETAERLTFDAQASTTYFLTVVNYTVAQALPYVVDLRWVDPTQGNDTLCPAPSSGGGATDPRALCFLLLLAAFKFKKIIVESMH